MELDPLCPDAPAVVNNPHHEMPTTFGPGTAPPAAPPIPKRELPTTRVNNAGIIPAEDVTEARARLAAGTFEQLKAANAEINKLARALDEEVQAKRAVIAQRDEAAAALVNFRKNNETLTHRLLTVEADRDTWRTRAHADLAELRKENDGLRHQLAEAHEAERKASERAEMNVVPPPIGSAAQPDGLTVKIGTRPLPVPKSPGGSISQTVIAADTILDEAARVTSVDRQKQYGPPEDSFNTIAELWATYLASRGWTQGSQGFGGKDVAMLMVLMKVAREANAAKRDNLVDIAGYARCAEMVGAGQ